MLAGNIRGMLSKIITSNPLFPNLFLNEAKRERGRKIVVVLDNEISRSRSRCELIFKISCGKLDNFY